MIDSKNMIDADILAIEILLTFYKIIVVNHHE